MTAVAFHFNVPDKLGYTCRLLRKVYRSGKRAVVVGEPAQLDQLNRRLWEFDPQEFIPHVRLKAQAAPERMLATPLWLADRAQAAPRCEVLVNLGEQLPDGREAFARLIEIVSTDEADRQSARSRWKQYAAQGWPIEKFEVPA
jgi:DNA polymerase-3 subunit chi